MSKINDAAIASHINGNYHSNNNNRNSSNNKSDNFMGFESRVAHGVGVGGGLLDWVEWLSWPTT